MSLTPYSGQEDLAAIFFDTVARHILAQHNNEVPDLRCGVVLLPNYHVAQPLTQSLARAANTPALLLPQMVTLHDWAQSVAVALPVTPDTCRATSLYQALRARRWFPDADLWGIARELLALLDELTQHQVTLPQDEQDFLAQLEQAYRARRGTAMQFEARLVYELWYAMNNNGELDAARAQQFRLAQLAQVADRPLTVLLATDLTAPEARFIEAYRQRAPVTVFDLREMVAGRAECAALLSLSGVRSTLSPALSRMREREQINSLSPQGERVGESEARGWGGSSLRDQAIHLRHHFPQGALTGRLRLLATTGLEQEASAAELQVRRWLLAGKKNIAIVAQDRLVARRVRALLERAEVLVSDETGWTLSTLAVSTVLMRWLDALQSDFYYQDLLDLLKSPFIFADQPAHERKQAVYQLEQSVRKHGVVSQLEFFLDLVRGEAAIETALVRLRQAADTLRKKNDTLSGWLHELHDSLDILGILRGLESDDAGVQLLLALQTWQRELQHDTTRFSLPEWRHWLAQQLDAHTFHDSTIVSTVLLTHLAATRWRSFDAVLLLGCDAAHLPSAENNSVWFNDAVRGTLGLPTRDTYLARQRDDLLTLLAMNDTVLVTWQASNNGEENLLSPFFEMLRAVHHLAYADNLTVPEDGRQRTEDRVLGGFATPPYNRREAATKPLSSVFCPLSSDMPQPVMPLTLIPQRISASGYNSLVACPYQFYARHILRLNELDEVRESIEKRDYGEWAHSILHRFHQLFPMLAQHPLEELSAALHDISREIFAPAIQHDYLARAWLQRWQQAIPAYLEAQLASEQEGWRYKNGEVPFDLPLAADLSLHGRVDRVDHQGESGAVRVLDYKMMDASRLRNRLKEPGEDVQLACYAQVYEAEQAAYISIEKDKVVSVVPPHDVPDLARANIERLASLFTMMRNGAPLPANGVEETCQYCEMRGLCRKGEWVSGIGDQESGISSPLPHAGEGLGERADG